MYNLTDILQCPVTGRDLEWTPDGRLSSEFGPTYLYRGGIAHMLPNIDGSIEVDDAGKEIRTFYDSYGWKKHKNGRYGDTNAFTDLRPISVNFSSRCVSRLGKYFKRGGNYLLDAGSGPIPHDGLLRYGENFDQRVCVDLSVEGLRGAQEKIGGRGVYIQGTLAKLPLKSNSMDAITCNHVIYQLSKEDQSEAFCELWRVLKPGGVAVIVYLWPYSPLLWRLEKLSKFLFRDDTTPQSMQTQVDVSPPIKITHNPLTEREFRAHRWPFRYTLDTFRIVSQSFLTTVTDNWRGRIFLHALFALQVVVPGFCGKYGAIPAIIIRKPLTFDPKWQLSTLKVEGARNPSGTLPQGGIIAGHARASGNAPATTLSKVSKVGSRPFDRWRGGTNA